MNRDEHGYIVVETLVSFLLLVLLVTSILSLINIVTIQSRIHYAMTQTAQTLSVYNYVLDATGAADHLIASANKGSQVEAEADELKGSINGVITGLQNLDLNQMGTHGEAAVDQVKGWADDISSDPKASLQLIMNYGLQQGGSQIVELLLRPLMGHYLCNGSISGDEYLKRYGIEDGLSGLQFHSFDLLDPTSLGSNDSTLITKDGEVKLVVQYDVDYSFGALPLPFDPKLHVTQEVVTRSWLGGKGEGYQP